MPSVKTNYLRVTHQIHYYQYQVLLCQNHLLENDDKEQLGVFLHNLDPTVLFDYPILYSPNKVTFTTFSFMLSRGVLLNVLVQFKAEGEQPKTITHIFQLLSIQILRNTQLLYSLDFHTVFNPFQQYTVSDDLSQIPGFSLEPSVQTGGLYIIPVCMSIYNKFSLNDPSYKILMDQSTGEFYKRVDIVRVDKKNNKIFFRNGGMVIEDNLKGCLLKNLDSYNFTRKLFQYFTRIKQTSNELLTKWKIQIDKKFLEAQHSFIQIGRIGFRGGVEKPLNEIVFPIARNSYNHYFRLMFENIVFDDVLEMEMLFFVPQSLVDNAYLIVKQFENIRDKMGLKFTTKILKLQNLINYEDIILLLSNHTRANVMHNFIIPQSLNQSQLPIINKLKQFLIDKSLYFHLINIRQETDQYDIVALRHLTIIYAKNRLNPWKMKDIPFGQKPTVVISLNVQLNSQDKYSIAMVCTLNSYLSKFTGVYSISNELELEEKIFGCLKECLEKFNSVHKAFPYRVFIYRTGYVKGNSPSQQFSIVRNKLTAYYGTLGNTKMNTLTYILMTKLHPLRTYMQIDQGSTSSDSIKKVQLLCNIKHNDQIYLQLQFDQPIVKIDIIEIEKDPSFVQKVLQLTCKIVYGSVGNEFGKGTGFIGFAQKLNEYRDFNLDGWRLLIKDSFMMFL